MMNHCIEFHHQLYHNLKDHVINDKDHVINDMQGQQRQQKWGEGLTIIELSTHNCET